MLEYEKRAEEEITLMACLSHRNIVLFMGATKHHDHINLFMELMPGTLSKLLLREGPLMIEDTLNYAEQLCSGLSYLHDNDIRHGDLKGDNLLVDIAKKELKLGDFGSSARLMLHEEEQGWPPGTIAFMAPEVLREKKYDYKSDVWSVGCVMLQMTTARRPWSEFEDSQLYWKIALTKIPPLTPENLPDAVRDAMKQCLMVQPEDRPTANDLLTAIRNIQI